MGQCSSALRSPRSSNQPSETGAPTPGPSGTQSVQEEPQVRDLRRRRSTDISHDNKRPRAHINQQGTDIPSDGVVDDREAGEPAAGPSDAPPSYSERRLSPVQSASQSPAQSPMQSPARPRVQSPAGSPAAHSPQTSVPRENPPLFGPGTDHPHFDLPNIPTDAPGTQMQPESRTDVQVATLSRMLYIAGLYTATTMVQGRFRSGELYAGSNGIAEQRQRNQQEVINRLREHMLDGSTEQSDATGDAPNNDANSNNANIESNNADTESNNANGDSVNANNDSNNANDSPNTAANSDSGADNGHMHVNLLRFLSQLRNGGHNTELSRLISEPDQIDNFFRLFRFPDDDGRTPVLLMGIRAVETRPEEGTQDQEPAHPGMQIPTLHVPLHPPPPPPPPGQPMPQFLRGVPHPLFQRRQPQQTTPDHPESEQTREQTREQTSGELPAQTLSERQAAEQEQAGQSASEQPASEQSAPEQRSSESADGLNFTNSEDSSTASVTNAEEHARRVTTGLLQASRLMSLVSNMAENDDDESEEETDQPLHSDEMMQYLEPTSADALASMALNAIIESELEQGMQRRRANAVDNSETTGNGNASPSGPAGPDGLGGAASRGPTEPEAASAGNSGPNGHGGPEPGPGRGPGGPPGPGGPGGPGGMGGPGLLTDPDRHISWMVYVLGGLYSSTHPVFTRIGQPDSPIYNDAQLVEWLLGVQKPLVARKEDVERSGGVSVVAEGDQLLNERCPVCLVDYDVDDECRTLHCGHLFHKTCVDEWLTKSHNSCPMCRQEGVTTRPGEATAQ